MRSVRGMVRCEGIVSLAMPCFSGDKLYWTDVYKQDVSQAKIESYDLNTGTRKIEATPGVHLMDILVDGEYYFYLSWSST